MRCKSNSLFIEIIILLISISSYASEYKVSYLNSRNGLPQNYVRSVCQDSKGFMWITTKDGLVRYDGYKFYTFQKNTRGLNSGMFLCVTEDRTGDVWIGSELNGVYRYDVMKDKFTRVSSYLPNKPFLQKTITQITVDEKNDIWVCTEDKGLYRISTLNKAQNKYKVDCYFSDCKYFSNVSIRYKSENLTVANGKVYVFDYDNYKFTLFHDEILTDINQILVYKDQLYVLKNGFPYLFNDTTFTLRSLGQCPAREMFVSSDDQLWLSNIDGLYKAPLLELGDMSCFEKIHTGIWTSCFKEDCFGNIWVGTYRNGILMFQKNNSPFRTYLRGKNAEAVVEDKHKNLWVATLNGEISILDSTSYTTRSTQNMEMIHTFTASREGNTIWIGSQAGVYKGSSNQNSPVNLEYILNDNNVKSVIRIIEDSAYLWIGTIKRGLFRYDMSKNESKRLFASFSDGFSTPSSIAALLKDRSGNIWIGSSEGLIFLDSKNRFLNNPQFKHFKFKDSANKELLPDCISFIHEAKEGSLWIGTLDNGLYQLKKKLQTNQWRYERYTTQNGLSNNSIKGILEDGQGKIWISTNKGLNCIDPVSKKINRYSIRDGLQDNEFCEGSCCLRKDGSLVFGGVGSLTSFNPQEFTEEKKLPIISFTDFIINNQSVKVGAEINGQVILDKSIEHSGSLTLFHRNNSFIIEYAGIQFANSDKIVYRYKLEGFDKRYSYTSAVNRYAKYTNIPSGRFRFNVSASYNGEDWTQPATIEIIVLKPLLLRWYFIVLYVFIALFVIYFAMDRYKRTQMRKNEVFLIKKEKEKIEELSEMKTNFFMNLSHEFRTPLTLIISPLQKLLSNLNIDKDELRRQLTNINYNSQILYRFVNQMLELSKFDKGMFQVELIEGDIAKLCYQCFSQFKTVAQDKGLIFSYNGASSIPFCFDPHKMEEVLYNLLSNAIKYTPEGGTVSLEVEKQEAGVYICVADSGFGMNEETKSHLFERFYSNSGMGIGIGMTLTKNLVELHKGTIHIESEEGLGTTVTVIFPDKTSAESVVSEDAALQFEEMEIESSPEGWDITENNSVSLLIVDDCPDMADLLEELFTPYYRVIKAGNGREAFEICANQQPDLVVTDVMMPVMDGMELCSRIKSNPITSHIPVILLTAKVSKKSQKEGFDVNADAFCPKPFDNEILLSTIRSILINRKKTAERFQKDMTEDPSQVFTKEHDKEFVKKILTIIEENIADETLNVQFICQATGLGQITLNKKIKSLTNQTANVFIRSVRLKHAAKMLSTKQYTVSEVTYAVGFNDLRYFRECFKKEYGVLPSDYVKLDV